MHVFLVGVTVQTIRDVIWTLRRVGVVIPVLDFQNLDLDPVPEKGLTVKDDFRRPEEELGTHVSVHRFRDANDDLVGDEIRVNAPSSRLEAP